MDNTPWMDKSMGLYQTSISIEIYGLMAREIYGK
jgi:hypothetical protein